MRVKPKKYFAQHFLIDNNIAKKIVDSLNTYKIFNVLEVGPGMGILTQYLLKNKSYQFKLIEVDRESVNYLQQKFPQLNDNIIHYDFLKYNLQSIFSGSIAIIGNFPYNISSQIFFKIIENRDIVPEVVGMVQKEVAERICGKPGSKIYGILSIFLQAFYNVEYLFTVNETVFHPPPKVKSAVIRLSRNEREELPCNEKLFFKIVKTSFNQRRKMLRNSLKSILLNLEFEDEMLLLRPEQLSISQFIDLTLKIEKQLQ